MEIDHPDNELRALVMQYVLPVFNQLVVINDKKTDHIIERCRLQHAIKSQELESPGPAADGCLFFSIRGMAHSYYYSNNKQRKCGTMIWSKCQFIFYSACLMDDEPRTEYIELLENSEVLYITYPDLLDLMHKYKDIENAIRLLALKQSACYYKQNLLLSLPPGERVEQFKAENKQFLNCSSQEIQAAHVNMSLRAYINHLNKLR